MNDALAVAHGIAFWSERVVKAEQDRIEAERAYEEAIYQLRAAVRLRSPKALVNEIEDEMEGKGGKK